MPPALMKKTVGKMGLRGQRGLRVQGRAGVPMAETLQPGERFRTPVEAEAAEAVRESVRCPRVVAGSNTTTTTSIKRKICRFFSTDDGCRFGEKCKFLHATSEGEEENKKSSSGGSFEKNNNNDKNHRRRRQRRRRRGGSGTLNQSNTASK